MSETTQGHPPGEYAIVELFGHTTLVGRIGKVERFGAKMLALEPIYRGELLPAVFHGGAAIYRLTPCTAAVAYARAPTTIWQVPAPIRAVIPQPLLAASEGDATEAVRTARSDPWDDLAQGSDEDGDDGER